PPSTFHTCPPHLCLCGGVRCVVGCPARATSHMSDSSSSDGEDTWIQWFCGLEGHEMFCEIDRGYIEDAFNLYGLRHFVPRINDSLDLILDRTAQNEASHELMEATCALYGLIHARYVLTAAGLEAMYAKYTLQEFGNCPHFLCKGQSVVPLGVRDEPHIETVKLYCPKCQDVYVHPSHAAQRVDGAYFGTTFPHLFFMTYGTLVPDPLDKTFVPRVFGFRVHSTAPNGASASGDRHDQRLQERKRLRRASLPPPKEPGGAGEGGTGVVAPAAGGEVAGAVASGAGKGKGRAKEGADAGGGRNGVVVRIKEEEGSWSTGGGGREKGAGAAAGKGPEKVAGEAEVEGADCRKGASSRRRSGASERMEDGGDRHGSSHGAENGHETSPTVTLQHSGTPTEGKGPAESNCVTIATPQRSDGGNAENGGARCSSHDRDAADANARAAAMAQTDGINNSEFLRRDACGVGRGSRSGDGAAQASAVAAATAAAAAAAATESSSKSDGPQKDRGKKRSSEVELETELSREAGGGGGDGGSGAGEAGGGGGGGGRTRGKVLRGGRNHVSPAARGVSSL
ncbi:unnamed protein product, partial [Ectocarpus sp. 8 AP-2014]